MPKHIEILIVEDSPTQAEQLRHLLEARGFVVTAAANGKEALTQLRHRKPTVIISDVVMPEVDGFALCEKVKSTAELKEIPVMLVTSLHSPQDVVSGLACGADNFIRKPYEEKYLLARIDYLLTTRELRKKEKTQLGIGIYFAGREYFINSDRQQILDLLISTYEEAVHINGELEARQKELVRSYEVLNGLYRIAADLNESMTEQKVVEKALERALELPGIQAGWIYLLDGEAGFRLAAARGLPPAVELSVPIDPECFCIRELLAGNITGRVNITECERLRRAREAKVDTRGLRYHASIPLRVGGRTLGLMNWVGKEMRLFNEEELKILQGVGDEVATALGRAQLLEQLERKVEERTVDLKAEIAERKRAEDALAQERNLLRTLINNLPDSIYVKDTEGRFLVANTGVGRLTGATTAEELLGKTDFDFFPKELATRNRTDEQEVIRSGQPLINQEEPTKDVGGNVRWVLSTRVPLRDAVGRVVGLVGIGRDITEHKQLEEQFRQAQKMEAIGRLAGGIAHDFNNLLTIISGYSQLLLERLNTGDTMRGYVEEIKNAGDRAASLTRQLLAFSRRQVLAPQVLDLHKVVGNSEKMLRRLIGEDIDLVTSYQPDLGWVKADPGQIEQVIMNLAVNARDAMPGGGKLTIETANVDLDENYPRTHAGVVPGRYVMLALSDSGVGMDEKTKSRIFEPFFTTKDRGKGTGLGLATVYGIVKQSGGDIWVYSEPGKGTTFKIYLPRVEETAAAVEPGKTPARATRGSETILVVEDEVAVRALVRGVLESRGYQVLEASSGEEALEISYRHEGQIHLVLTDVIMREMSGRELALRLAASHPETKVVYMSGYTDNAIVHHGVLDEGTPFLQKPFTPEALANKVREVLDQ